MPAAYLRLYEVQSTELKKPLEVLKDVNKLAGNKLLSEDCLKTVEDLMCVQMNCTEDEEYVTLPNMETKCKKMMNW